MRDILDDDIIIIEIIGTFLIILLWIAFVFFIFNVRYKASIKHDNKLWNGGRCDICGRTWEYEQAVGHRSSTSYIYVCRKCGKRIELSEER